MKTLKRTVLLSQRRWGSALMQLGGTNWDAPIDISKLAVAPLRELHLYEAREVPPRVEDGVLLTNLSILSINLCHRSVLLLLLPLAPNLERLSIEVYPAHSLSPPGPPVHLQHLRTLFLGRAKIILEKIVCPAVQHLYTLDKDNCPNLYDVQRFIERNNLQLLSLGLAAYTASDALLILHSLRSLTSLDLFAVLPERFLTKLVKEDPADGQFTLCPVLEDVALGSGGHLLPDPCAAMIRFIEARWRTPFRSLRKVKLRYRGIALNEEPWEPVRRCMEEGLRVTHGLKF